MKFPSKNQWERLFDVLNKREKFLFSFLLILFFTCGSFLFFDFWQQITKIVPAEGGIFVEGTLEEPRFLNPIFATSQVDKDLTFLLFSPLFEFKEGKILPALAKSFQILENGKIFKIILREDIFWEDGKKIDADDILFTVSLLQDPETKSPFRNSWLGVKVKKISANIVIFELEEPSAIFLANLNLRPIPKHYFEQTLPKDLAFSPKNLLPLSSGPFKLEKINSNKEGEIISVELKRNEKYFGEKPYIEKIVFKVFENEEELIKAAKRNLIDGYLEKEEVENFEKIRFYLPRYFALFFNLENEILKEKKIREALSLSINKKEILKEVLGNEGKLVFSPLMGSFWGIEIEKKENFDSEKAKKILDELGFVFKEGKREKLVKKEPQFVFKKDLELGSRGKEVRELQKCLMKFEDVWPEGEVTGYFGKETEKAVKAFQEKFKKDILEPFGLSKGTGKVKEKTREKLNEVCFEKREEKIELKFKLVTGKDEVLQEVARITKKYWEKLGVKVNLEFWDIEKLETEILPKKDYDILLFGQMYDRILDPFPFWHSSQIDGGKLNLSNFKNEKADRFLIEAREEINQEKREEKLKNFEKIFLEERPAILLFNPNLNYFISKKTKGVYGGKIFEPAERFLEIEKWYIKEKRQLK